METIRPIYKKALIAAIAIYAIGMAFLLSDLYAKVGSLELAMMHITGACKSAHNK